MTRRPLSSLPPPPSSLAECPSPTAGHCHHSRRSLIFAVGPVVLSFGAVVVARAAPAAPQPAPAGNTGGTASAPVRATSSPAAASSPSASAAPAAGDPTIIAVRLWPSIEYTRVTIESDRVLSAKHSLVDSPPRLTVDLEGLELDAALRELVGQVRPDDPFIHGMRAGQFQPRVVRIVFDLKQAVRPEQFALQPVPSPSYVPATSRQGAVSVMSSKPAGSVSTMVAVVGSLNEKVRHASSHSNSSPGTRWLPPEAVTWVLLGKTLACGLSFTV